MSLKCALENFVVHMTTNLFVEYAHSFSGGISADFHNKNLWDMTFRDILSKTKFKFFPMVVLSFS